MYNSNLQVFSATGQGRCGQSIDSPDANDDGDKISIAWNLSTDETHSADDDELANWKRIL